MIRKLTVEEYAEVQARTNDVMKPGWRETMTREDYQVAIIDELSEYLGSGRAWKWWKKASGEVDLWNEKIEIIDIVHFYLSAMLVDNNVITGNVFIGYYEDEDPICKFHNPDGTLNRKAFADMSRRLMAKDVLPTHCLVYLNNLLQGVGLTQEEASAVFIAKAALNEFRTYSGYQDGSYVKVQDGIEDNERLRYIVGAFLHDPNMTLDDVRRSVEEEFFVRT